MGGIRARLRFPVPEHPAVTGSGRPIRITYEGELRIYSSRCA